MKVADSIAFLDNRRRIDINYKDGGNGSFIVALNMRTGLFFNVVALLTGFDGIEAAEQKDVVTEIVAEMLSTSNGDLYSVGWVRRNLTEQTQIKLIEKVFEMVSEQLQNECFKVPDIKVVKTKPTTKSKDTTTKQRETKRENIERAEKLLAGKIDSYLTNEIMLVSSKTNNSYFDVLEMPLFVFKCLVKDIILNEKRADDDYNYEYLKYEADRIKVDLIDRANKKPDAPNVDRGAELSALLVNN